VALMARKKNSTFTGGTTADIDIGAPSFRRLVADAVGDTALLFDKATGSNGETGVIVHDGGVGTGARLGIPVVNQWCGRSITLTGHDTTGKNGGVGDTWIWAAPFLCAAGESDLRIEVGMNLQGADDTLAPYAKVCTTANVEVDRRALTVADAGEIDDVYSCHLTGITPGWNLLFIGLDTTNIDDETSTTPFLTLSYVRARPRLRMRGRNVGSGDGYASTAPAFNEVGDLYGVTTPAATEGVAHTNFDAALFANLESIDGYVLSRLNRNLAGLTEYVTGYPAGNTNYTHEDQDGAGVADPSNPARVRFEYHSRALYSSEGQIDFPLWTEGFGAFQPAGFFAVDLAEPPTKGMLNGYAPWPKAAAVATMRSAFVPVPDFQSTSSRLQCAVLLGSTNGATADPAQWTIRCRNTTDATGATATPVDTDGTNILWLATITAVPFTGDRDELFDIRMSRAAAKPAGTDGIGEVCLLGASLAFVKP
jgi:hypothetical protein